VKWGRDHICFGLVAGISPRHRFHNERETSPLIIDFGEQRMALEIFQTSNFQVQYELTDYSQAELLLLRPRAQVLLGGCEPDYATMCGWFGITVGDGLGPANRVVITLTKNVRGASNTGFSTNNPQMSVNPNLGGSDDSVLGLFVDEMSEILMSFKGNWDPLNSGGEGLSRVAGELLHPNSAPNTKDNNVNAWLASDPTTDPTSAKADSVFRKDWVSANFTGGDLRAGGSVAGDQDSYSFGCAMLFIYYLKDQLGFTMDEIVQNGTGTLDGTYRSLTKTNRGGFSPFRRLIDFNFPTTNSPSLTDNPFPLPLLHTGTPLAQNEDGNGDFLAGDFDGDNIADMFFIKRKNTGTNTIEIHVLSGESNFQKFILQTGTALPQSEDQNGDFLLADFDHDGIPDLFFIKRRNTGTNQIEVHILSGKSKYQQFLVRAGTSLAQTEDLNGDFAIADFDRDGVPDLFFIKRRNTGANSIEVHVLTGKSNYQQFVVHTGTPLTQGEDRNGDFLVADFDRDGIPDLYFIKRRNTSTNQIEIHVLSGQSSYQQFAIHTPTVLAQSEDVNGSFQAADFDSDGRADLFFIKRRNTGTNSIEVHVLAVPV